MQDEIECAGRFMFDRGFPLGMEPVYACMMQNAEVLQQRFGCSGVSFFSGHGGLAAARLRDASGHALEVYCYGAQATKWLAPDGSSLLFLSERATFEEGKAIRGGIPIIFPQFGPGPIATHGFARCSEWSVVEALAGEGRPQVVLELRSSAATQAIWPHIFLAQIRLTLGPDLRIDFKVINMDATAFDFQVAFHTYFGLREIADLRVPGFKGIRYLDNLKNKSAEIETRDSLVISEEVDRIYCDTAAVLEVTEAGRRNFQIEKSGLDDAVLWNPWIEKSKKLVDLQPDDYRRFVCLECGQIEKPVHLNPGNTFEARVILRYAQKYAPHL